MKKETMVILVVVLLAAIGVMIKFSGQQPVPDQATFKINFLGLDPSGWTLEGRGSKVSVRSEVITLDLPADNSGPVIVKYSDQKGRSLLVRWEPPAGNATPETITIYGGQSMKVWGNEQGISIPTYNVRGFGTNKLITAYTPQ